MPSIVAGRWVRHARKPALIYQVFVCLQPGGHSGRVRDPVGVRGFVTPFHQTRHSFRVRSGAAKRLHTSPAVPRSQGPECATRVYKESSAEEPRCVYDLTLTKKSLPHECRDIFHGANAKTRN